MEWRNAIMVTIALLNFWIAVSPWRSHIFDKAAEANQREPEEMRHLSANQKFKLNAFWVFVIWVFTMPYVTIFSISLGEQGLGVDASVIREALIDTTHWFAIPG